jgi:hypothetical protein
MPSDPTSPQHSPSCYALMVAAGVWFAAGVVACSSPAKPAGPATSPTAARPSLAPAVTVDDAARQGCRLLIQAKADTADVAASDPLLRQAARSQHFSLRSDGQALGRDLDIYAGASPVDRSAASVAVAASARRVERDCAAEGAEK